MISVAMFLENVAMFFPKQYRINLDQDAVKKSHHSIESFPAWIQYNILDAQKDEPSKEK